MTETTAPASQRLFSLVTGPGEDIYYATDLLNIAHAMADTEARLDTTKYIGDLAVSMLRAAYLFKGYGDGPLQANAKIIESILEDWAALARKENTP